MAKSESKGDYISMAEFWFKLGQCDTVQMCAPVEAPPYGTNIIPNTIAVEVSKEAVLKATQGFIADYQVYSKMDKNVLYFGFSGCF